mmetsp:Transcript_13195/g.29322  ORF Transcript_13195/g.29322 Transcript_13195/m.29322 type:complete len:260 (+) Transcript_13195:366-1145(+)
MFPCPLPHFRLHLLVSPDVHLDKAHILRELDDSPADQEPTDQRLDGGSAVTQQLNPQLRPQGVPAPEALNVGAGCLQLLAPGVQLSTYLHSSYPCLDALCRHIPQPGPLEIFPGHLAAYPHHPSSREPTSYPLLQQRSGHLPTPHLLVAHFPGQPPGVPAPHPLDLNSRPEVLLLLHRSVVHAIADQIPSHVPLDHHDSVSVGGKLLLEQQIAAAGDVAQVHLANGGGSIMHHHESSLPDAVGLLLGQHHPDVGLNLGG